MLVNRAALVLQVQHDAALQADVPAEHPRPPHAQLTSALQTDAATSLQAAHASSSLQASANQLHTVQQLLAQLDHTAAGHATDSASVSSVEPLQQQLAAQAAELASARQAMQLLAQLLESMPQPAEHADNTAPLQGASSVEGMRELVSQLVLQSQQAAAAPPDVTQNQSELVAAQAAELAAARQAMQLMAQLLEQSPSAHLPADEASSSDEMQQSAPQAVVRICVLCLVLRLYPCADAQERSFLRIDICCFCLDMSAS